MNIYEDENAGGAAVRTLGGAKAGVNPLMSASTAPEQTFCHARKLIVEVRIFHHLDNDGRLDLYVVNAGTFIANGRSALYRNLGDGTFTNVGPRTEREDQWPGGWRRVGGLQ